MNIWGVFLEDNTVRIPEDDLKEMQCITKKAVSAVALQGGAAAPKQQPAPTIRETAMAALDPDNLRDAVGKAWAAPRCRNDTVLGLQGPLRCSLARLAWEYC